MSEPTSLANILDDRATPPEPTPEPVAAPAPAEPAAPAPDRPRGPDGKFIAEPAAVEPTAPPPTPEPAKPEPPQFSPKERAFLAAAEDERRKRQALEQELATLKASQPQQPKPEEKSFWDDPEGFVKASEARAQALAMQTRLSTYEAIARSKYQDFDKKIEVFAEVLKTTPGLREQWLSSQDPAEYAYKTGKNFLDIREAGSIEQMRQQIEKETRIKLEQEYKAKQEALEKERAALPGSLSDARGATVNKPLWGGPTSLDLILKP